MCNWDEYIDGKPYEEIVAEARDYIKSIGGFESLLSGIILMNKMSLNEQAQEILRIAEQHGVEQNFFFLTTFKRYKYNYKSLMI